MRRYLVYSDKLPPLPVPLAVVKGFFNKDETTIFYMGTVTYDYHALRGNYWRYPTRDLLGRCQSLSEQDGKEEMSKANKKLFVLSYQVGAWDVNYHPQRHLWLTEPSILLSGMVAGAPNEPWFANNVSNDPQYEDFNIATDVRW